MIITRHGEFELKIQTGDTIVGFNPPSKNSKLKGAKFGASVALASLNHSDFNSLEEFSFGEKRPFAITGPGEYEVKSVFIKGFGSKSSYGLTKEIDERINTIYVLSMDGLNVVHLGALSDEKLSNEALEAMEEVDILVLHVGGETLEPAKAAKLAVFLEPKLIIPLGELNDQKQFAKEVGQKPEESEKLTLKKKDLEGKVSAVAFI